MGYQHTTGQSPHLEVVTRDPVCGMAVDPASATFRARHDGHTYWLCSAYCLERFTADPERFVGNASATVQLPGAPSGKRMGRAAPWNLLWPVLALQAGVNALVALLAPEGSLSMEGALGRCVAANVLVTAVFIIVLWLVAEGRWRPESARAAPGTDRFGPPRRIGAYRLTSLIGTGGMGQVWLGIHDRLGRPAAIKLIRPEGVGTTQAAAMTAFRRFEREAHATANLRSPHTIEVYDHGLTQDGAFYYVMELLDGLDLETLIEQHGPQPAERVVHVLLQACHSLGEAHERGLVHRDVKPANMYVCRYGREYDFVKVLDFGLVTERAGTDEEGVAITERGTIVGTPAFLSPEVAVASGPVDARADLYSLGCVAWWMLTGRLPFDANTPISMVLKHVHEPANPPSAHSELRIPPELDAIVLWCLEKNPRKRPRSADELAERLQACPLESVWTPERARAWWETYQPSKNSTRGEHQATRS